MRKLVTLEKFAVLFVLCANCLISVSCAQAWTIDADTNIFGTVLCDGKPIEGVWVCDGDVFACTDRKGRYEMSSSKRNGTVYVSVPSGYKSITAEDAVVPSFFHKISSDSSAVERVDFQLEKQNQSTYSAIFLPDVHLCNNEPLKHDLKYFLSVMMPAYRSLYDKLSAVGPVMTIELGDISHDRYWFCNNFDLQNVYDFVRNNGIHAPFYGVTGNHDHNPAIVCSNTEDGDFQAQETFRKLFGPDRYSINISTDHWIFLDDIQYINTAVDHSPYEGVAGGRDYEVGLTEAQIKWLEKDLSLIPGDMHVIVCLHAPLDIPQVLKDRGNLDIFAGHIHRMEISRVQESPAINLYALSAVSGNMWECYPDNHVVGLDGSEGALHYVTVTSKSMNVASESYTGDNPYFRIYDMNMLRKDWSVDKDKTWIMNQVRDQIDYTSTRYSNMILVNFWCYVQGARLEILEDGKPLDVARAPFKVDPEALYQSFNFRRASYEGKAIDLEKKELAYAMLYCARASEPSSRITVRAYRPDGTLMAEQTVDRSAI